MCVRARAIRQQDVCVTDVLVPEYVDLESLGQCSFVEGDSGQRALQSMLLGTQTASWEIGDGKTPRV